MYPNTGAALINAFNTTLFESYKSSGWQRLASELGDKYPELDQAAFTDHTIDINAMTKSDWAAQAGMVCGLIRDELSTLNFYLMKIRYTFDGEILEQQECSIKLNITDHLWTAINEGWPLILKELISNNDVPKTDRTKENRTRLEYLALRALRPDVFKTTYRASGVEIQRTVDNHQSIVKKAVNKLIRTAYLQCQEIFEANCLTTAVTQ